MGGLFGTSSHEKDVDKRDTSKEKTRPQYYELFGLLAKFSTPSTIALILIPLKEVRTAISHSKRHVPQYRVDQSVRTAISQHIICHLLETTCFRRNYVLYRFVATSKSSLLLIIICTYRLAIYTHITILQEEVLHWKLNFVVSLMPNLRI